MHVYLDSNATSMPAPPVVEAMLTALRDDWGNASSVHRFGQRARQRVELARAQIASLLHCKDREIIFTSGSTESCNLAIRGTLAARPTRRTVITNLLEHSAVREPCRRLAEVEGYNVIWLPVSIDGLVNLDALAAALDQHGSDTALVAIHWINNETGTIQPIEAIGQLCRQHNVPLFSDATQAIGKVPCDLSTLPIDLLACSAHKFHGPKGAGLLYVRKTVGLVPQMLGGPHERQRRGGTENVPGIVGMGMAAQLAAEFLATDGPDIGRQRRDRLEAALLAAVPEAVVNSAHAPRLWNTLNIAFPPLHSEAILLLLSERGISAAAGAACSSGSLEPSAVLLAQGIAEPIAHASIRLSLSRYTTDDEIAFAIQTIPQTIEKLRQTMPVG
jgi:cysteine desulfurase